MNTEQFADQLSQAIQHAIQAHTEHARSRRDMIRYWDQYTPYAIHPIWCAMTLLTETMLPTDIRQVGYQALLWHDMLEDTLLPLPQDASLEVRQLVDEMTFASFAEEKELLWQRSDLTKLLKLYDKVSNLLDGTWMINKGDKWNEYVDHTLRLADFVATRYGSLNIVKIARAIAIPQPADENRFRKPPMRGSP